MRPAEFIPLYRLAPIVVEAIKDGCDPTVAIQDWSLIAGFRYNVLLHHVRFYVTIAITNEMLKVA